MNFSDFHALVARTRSVRRFKQHEAVPMELLLGLVDCARLSPSPRNQQLLRFRIVADPQGCAAVFPHLKWAAALTWSGPAEGERAPAYLFFLKPAGAQTACDSGIVGQTIKLAASAAGYASCMLGAIDRPAAHKALALPADLEIDIAIAIGKPGETVQLETAVPGSPTHYWRSADDIHHVPKLPRETLLV
jgi:nitroreductase